MTTYAVTGATGHLGPLVLDALLARGVPATDLVAIARTPAKGAALADRGITVRPGDYSRPDTVLTALSGVDVLLLVSGNEIGRRVAQHAAVVDAARRAGVGRIAYTSLLRADTSPMVLAPEHKATEELLRSSGVPFTILRNGWYLENYTERLDEYTARGAILGAAGDGRISAAAGADYAAAAAAVLTEDGHDGAIYELGGPDFTLTELAAEITEVTGSMVVYKDFGAADLRTALAEVGLDEGTAGFVTVLDEAIARGDLYTTSTDMVRLIGRPATSSADVVRAAGRHGSSAGR